MATIVKKISEIVPEKVGDFRRWYLSKAEPGHELSVRYVEVTGIVPPHTHYTEETIFYIEGKGTARVGEREVRIKPGTMLVIPPGTVHCAIKEGPEPLRYLAMLATPTFDGNRTSSDSRYEQKEKRKQGREISTLPPRAYCTNSPDAKRLETREILIFT